MLLSGCKGNTFFWKSTFFYGLICVQSEKIQKAAWFISQQTVLTKVRKQRKRAYFIPKRNRIVGIIIQNTLKRIKHWIFSKVQEIITEKICIFAHANRVLSRIGWYIKAFAITMKKDNCTQHADKDSCVGLTSSALPEANNKIHADSSDTGVSTHCIPAKTESITKNSKEQQNWYALRTTYGREKKAYDYLVAKGVSSFYTTIQVMK